MVSLVAISYLLQKPLRATEHELGDNLEGGDTANLVGGDGNALKGGDQ